MTCKIRMKNRATHANGGVAALDASRAAPGLTSGELEGCGDRKKRESEQGGGGELHVWSAEAVVGRLGAVRLKNLAGLSSLLYVSTRGYSGTSTLSLSLSAVLLRLSQSVLGWTARILTCGKRGVCDLKTLLCLPWIIADAAATLPSCAPSSY